MMKRRNRIYQELMGLAASLVLGGMSFDASACTALTLTAKNGDVVYGRTQEWGTFDIHSRLVFYPRNYNYAGQLTEGKTGLKWKGRYGMVGIDGLNKGFLIDGMNERGMTAGLLYHPGYATYEPLTARNASRAIRPTDVLNLVLSSCQNVDEVRHVLEKSVVAAVNEEALGFPAPVHILVTERTGRQLVVEWKDGVPQFMVPEVGVLTNSPWYDWHVTNLRNYLHLSNRPSHAKEVSSIKLEPLGGGSGLLGLPGDFTPTSRFVRAVALKSIARPFPDGAEGIYEMFHILDNFNVPLGQAEGDGKHSLEGLRSSTVWTVAYDPMSYRMFYHTHNDRRVQMVDLRKVDFTAFKSMNGLPLDKGYQSVLDRTPGVLK